MKFVPLRHACIQTREGPSGRPGRLPRPPGRPDRPPGRPNSFLRPPELLERPPGMLLSTNQCAWRQNLALVDFAPADKTPPCSHVRRAPGRPDKLPGRPGTRPRLPGRPERYSRPLQLLEWPPRIFLSIQPCAVDNILPLSTRTTSRMAVARTWLLSKKLCFCRQNIAPVDSASVDNTRLGQPPGLLLSTK